MTDDDRSALAAEAFIYGFPLVFRPVMRMYVPGAPLLEGRYEIPAIRRLREA